MDDDAQINRALVHVLQAQTAPPFKHRVGCALGQAIKAMLVDAPTAHDRRTDQLAADGYVRLGQVLSADECAAVRQSLEQRPCFATHVVVPSNRASFTPSTLGECAKTSHLACYELAEVIEAPGLWETANRPDILSLAETYLGCCPTLYSLNAWWSFPRDRTAKYTQHFHRDFDDFKFCTLFVYLTDVDENSGPHRFIRKSHQFEFLPGIVQAAEQRLGRSLQGLRGDQFFGVEQGPECDRLYTDVFGDLIDTIVGPAGFAFLADTSALHMGVPPISSRRLMFWARYGLYTNPMALSPVAAPARIAPRLTDSRTAHINRCIVRV